jgi:hypothetical protein
MNGMARPPRSDVSGGGEPPEDEPPFDLGDHVLYRGARYLVDDEALIGLEGQGDVLWGQFDPEELVRVP